MRNLRERLPPLTSLVVFEAAAHHLSFTKAARELRVSREAVSRQIRVLEEHLEQKLFQRLYRAVELTEAGQALHDAVAAGFGGIARAVAGLRQGTDLDRVVVSATVALASFWLTPRLPGFRAAHPGTEIRVMVSDRPHDLTLEGIDLGLRYGDGDWPDHLVTHLFDTLTFPVCAPDYREHAPRLDRPADLLDHTLLNLDGGPHIGEDWAWWLNQAAVEPLREYQVLGFDNYANVIQAALDGQGVALGFGGVIDGLLQKGSLVRPLDAVFCKGLAVHIAVPKRSHLSPSAQDFFDWVVAEAKGNRRDGRPP